MFTCYVHCYGVTHDLKCVIVAANAKLLAETNPAL